MALPAMTLNMPEGLLLVDLGDLGGAGALSRGALVGAEEDRRGVWLVISERGEDSGT